MGASVSNLFESNNHHIVLLGLDHAGKTTILYRLKNQKMVIPTPTVGFNCERFKVINGPARGHTFVMWDVGGQESFRNLWPTYLKNTSALIFVVDASDSRRFEEAKVELDTILLKIPHLPKFPVFILANKQDKPEAISVEEVFEIFAADIKNKCEISAISCCAVTGEGLENFFSQVLIAIQRSKK